MKKSKHLIIYTVVSITSYIIYKQYKYHTHSKTLSVALAHIANNNIHAAIKILLNLYHSTNDPVVLNHLIQSWQKIEDFNKIIEYSSDNHMLIFECYLKMKKYNNALFHIFMHFNKQNDDKIMEKIKETLNLCVNESVIKHSVKKVSAVIYFEFFETFPFLFTDYFNTKISNKAGNGKVISAINVVDFLWIGRRHYERVKKFLKNEDYAELRHYIEDRFDNLSIFMRVSLDIIEMKTNQNVYDRNMLYKKWTNSANKKYELKIYTYCLALFDYINKKTVDYEYEDISTYLYKIKSSARDIDKYIDKILDNGVYAFVYFELIKFNQHLLENALVLFPYDIKILSMAFEIYLCNDNHKYAYKLLEKMKMYHKNDPRTFLSLYYKKRIMDGVNEVQNVEILLDAYKLDPLYYKISMLIGHFYLEIDGIKAAYYLRNAIDCCNMKDDLYKIYETYIINETKCKVLAKLNNMV